MKTPIEVFAYYFPNYHLDARNALTHGPQWDEWSLVKEARPRFPGHVQPKVPLWGYEDEADPQAMADAMLPLTKKIEKIQSPLTELRLRDHLAAGRLEDAKKLVPQLKDLNEHRLALIRPGRRRVVPAS